MDAQELMKTATALVAGDKGLLAMDESDPTCNKRFTRVGIPQNGLVPIVEAEVLMDGEHTLERCREVTEDVLRAGFQQLCLQRVILEGVVLKPNMVVPGLACPRQAEADEVANVTVRCLLRTVPATVPVLAFLSGGQSGELPSACLIWKGEPDRVPAAQQALAHRARCDRAARRGEYESAMERKS